MDKNDEGAYWLKYLPLFAIHCEYQSGPKKQKICGKLASMAHYHVWTVLYNTFCLMGCPKKLQKRTSLGASPIWLMSHFDRFNVLWQGLHKMSLFGMFLDTP